MINKLFKILRTYMRSKRYQQIQQLVHVMPQDGFVLDLGGGPASFFAAMYPRPEQIILVEIDYKLAVVAKRQLPRLHVVVANGEQLPFATKSISNTICNSVIEHVNDPEALASETSRVSKNYFVQTPNGSFPLEPHSLIAIPFYNYLPTSGLRKLVCKIFGADYEYVDSVRYLSENKLRSIFPEARIAYERVFRAKKSFYIYRSDKHAQTST